MKNNAYLCKPQFYYIKVGFKGVKIIQACFRYADGLLSGKYLVFILSNLKNLRAKLANGSKSTEISENVIVV